MINIEREIIIFSTVAGVGQNIPATFGKAQKYVSKTKSICTLLSTVLQKSHLKKIIIKVLHWYRSERWRTQTLTQLSGTPRWLCSSKGRRFGGVTFWTGAAETVQTAAEHTTERISTSTQQGKRTQRCTVVTGIISRFTINVLSWRIWNTGYFYRPNATFEYLKGSWITWFGTIN